MQEEGALVAEGVQDQTGGAPGARGDGPQCEALQPLTREHVPHRRRQPLLLAGHVTPSCHRSSVPGEVPLSAPTYRNNCYGNACHVPQRRIP
ncbi:hypothetical protein NUM3379_19800 [Kineococcus sp. NUM-3379]